MRRREGLTSFMDNRDYQSSAPDASCSESAQIFAYRLSRHSCRFVQVDRLESVASFPDVPSDPAVVVLDPHEEITPESFVAWLDRRQAGEPIDPGVRAADTLPDTRTAGEV